MNILWVLHAVVSLVGVCSATEAEIKKFKQQSTTGHAADIKIGITEANAHNYYGIGGTYGFLKNTVSKIHLIEADHWPPKSLYKIAPDESIKNINVDKMAALSLPYRVHRDFVTTNVRPENSFLAEAMKNGQYKEVVDLSIVYYRNALSKTWNEVKWITDLKSFEKYKAELIKYLDVHVKNGLITNADRTELITKYELDQSKFKFDSPLREQVLQLREKSYAASDTHKVTIDNLPNKVMQSQNFDTMKFGSTSEQIIKKYVDGSPETRLKIWHYLESEYRDGPNRKLASNAESDRRVSKILQYERLKKENARTEYVTDALHAEGLRFESADSSGTYQATDLLQKTKLSPTATARKLWHTRTLNAVGKTATVASKYFLIKNVVDGINHGDTKSQAIMGARIGTDLFLDQARAVAVRKASGKISTTALSKFSKGVLTKAGRKLGVQGAAKVFGRGIVAVGKVAGPLGLGLDVGFSSWYLGEAVGRLSNKNATIYEQTEAVIVIAESYVDIITAMGTYSLAVAFPPAAPIIFAVSLLVNVVVSKIATHFKAINHVNEIDSKVLLLSHEREKEVSRYKNREDTSDYLQNIMNVQYVNNLIADDTVRFLKNNSDVIGRVYPSYTFSTKGRCKLTREHCYYVLGICNSWVNKNTLSDSCYHEGGDCDGIDRKCDSADTYQFTTSYYCGQYTINRFLYEDNREGRLTSSTTYTPALYNIVRRGECRESNRGAERWRFNYRCTCSGNEETKFGSEHENSKVDFRSIQRVHLERGAPKTLVARDYGFKCRPSSTSFRGDRIDLSTTSDGYLCENAVAIRQINGRGKFMLYELGTGSDEIYLDSSETVDNQFVVMDGRKIFRGSQGSDMFAISGPCEELRGELDGGSRGKANTLVIQTKCAPGSELHIYSPTYYEQRISGGGGLNITIGHIHNIVGRAGLREVINCSCGNRLVKGLGGRSGISPDSIHIPKYPCTSGSYCRRPCSYNLTIIAGKFTTITNDAEIGNVTILVPGDDVVHFMYDGRSSKKLHTVLLLEIPIQKLSSYLFRNASRTEAFLQLEFGADRIAKITSQEAPNSSETIPDTPEHLAGITLYFAEGNGQYSRIFVSDGSDVIALHELQSVHDLPQPLSRRGASVLTNYFILEGGQWNVIGGHQSDYFSLQSRDFSGRISGGSGGHNTLRIDESLSDPRITLCSSATAHTPFCASSKISYENIQTVSGRRYKADTIVPGCDTNLITLNGGLNASLPDKIFIQDFSDCFYNLEIHAAPATELINEALNGSFRYFVIGQSWSSCEKCYFSANFSTTAANQNYFSISYPLYDLLQSAGFRHRDENSYQVHLGFSTGFEVRLQFRKSDNGVENEDFLGQPEIYLGADGGTNVNQAKVLIGAETGSLSLLHTITDKGRNIEHFGGKGVINLFRLLNGSTPVIGGDKDDTFILYSASYSGKISGGGGTNSLFIDDNLESPFVELNLDEAGINNAFQIRDVQKIRGRFQKMDKIVTACSTIFIDLGGGNTAYDQMDEILVPDSTKCADYSLSIIVPSFTSVRNFATYGNFVYHIQQEENYTLEMRNSKNIAHTLQFQFGFKNISSVNFDQFSSLVTFKMSSGVTFSYKMDAMNSNSNSYSHPTLQFVDSETNIVCDLRVMHDGNPYTIFDIKSMFRDATHGILGANNNFRVDTKSDEDQLGEIVGGDKNDIFRIFSVNSMSELNGGEATNTLKLFDGFKPGEVVVINLNLQNGSIQTENNSGVALILKLKNFQVFEGREQGVDKVFVSCQTQFVNKVQQIYVTDVECADVNVKFVIGQDTSVSFSPDPLRYAEYEAFEGGTFVYEFKTLRSFDIEMDAWDSLRRTSQIYNFHFDVSELQEISVSGYNDELTLFYKIGGSTYSHKIDDDISDEEEYFLQPRFLSKDGFEFQISRTGYITFVLTLWNSELTNLEIQDFAQKYGRMAILLDVTFLIQTKSDFIYIGHNSSADQPSVLSNINMESHLVGGGANTIYVILNSNSDVYIYPGFESVENIKQIVDLTSIVWQIRNSTGTKYIPALHVSGPDLIISMDGFTDEFKSKVYIMGGVVRYAQFQILLNTAVMEIQEVSNKDERKKRSTNFQQKFILTPSIIEIERGYLVVLSAEDLENGQTITTKEVPYSDNFSSRFSAIKNGSELIVSNLATTTDMNTVISLIILDHFKEPVNTSLNLAELGSVKGLTVLLGDLVLNVSEIVAEELDDWEDTVEASEELLLKDLPEIPKQFCLPLWKAVWKRHKVLASISLVSLLAVVFFFVYIVSCVRMNTQNGKYNMGKAMVVREKEVVGLELPLVPVSPETCDAHTKDLSETSSALHEKNCRKVVARLQSLPEPEPLTYVFRN